VLDFGLDAAGGLEAGLRLAEICLAGLGTVQLIECDRQICAGPAVMVFTDHPVPACLASQYAGWEIKSNGYFAMGSGPMRAAAAREPLFGTIGCHETPQTAVGIMESDHMVPDQVAVDLAAKCGVSPDRLLLATAPTRSQAGSLQVVARSVETALHKLHELSFDVARVATAIGTAPLPPAGADPLTAIGRTNDAIIYGGQVTLYLRGDDETLLEVGSQLPGSASDDFGDPFLKVFQRYDHDFYRVDPKLFSPAVVTLVNLDTGRSFRFGHLLPRVIHESFG
jgi:methenyltetrahydromethanopterin cyclohydrolase